MPRPGPFLTVLEQLPPLTLFDIPEHRLPQELAPGRPCCFIASSTRSACPASTCILMLAWDNPNAGRRLPSGDQVPKPYVKYPKLGSWLENDVIEAEDRALAAAGASEDDESISEEYIRVEVGPVGERLDRRGLGCERPGRAD